VTGQLLFFGSTVMMKNLVRARSVAYQGVAMSKSSQHDQFMDLLLRHQNQVFGYIFAAVRNLHDAEELYQETSLVLWRKFSVYRPGTDFARWACKTAKHKILHFQQDRRRSPIRFSDEVLSNLAEVQASKNSEASQHHQEVLAECTNELSPADQLIVDLCYGGQDSIKEVAEKLERSPQTLYNAVSRIRRALFDCIRLRLIREQKR
jgi:RNA polymerase sigma-70 factor, ECF subfamily